MYPRMEVSVCETWWSLFSFTVYNSGKHGKGYFLKKVWWYEEGGLEYHAEH